METQTQQQQQQQPQQQPQIACLISSQVKLLQQDPNDLLTSIIKEYTDNNKTLDEILDIEGCKNNTNNKLKQNIIAIYNKLVVEPFIR